MFTETQDDHTNPYLNMASNVMAILLGCILAITHKSTPTFTIPNNFLTLFFNPETFEILLRSAAGGTVAYFAKVGCEIIVVWFKSRNQKKGGNHE